MLSQDLDQGSVPRYQSVKVDSITLRLDKSYLRHSYSYTMQGIEQPRMALSFDRLEVKSLKRVEYQIATMFASSSSINFILIFNPAYAKWR